MNEEYGRYDNRGGGRPVGQRPPQGRGGVASPPRGQSAPPRRAPGNYPAHSGNAPRAAVSRQPVRPAPRQGIRAPEPSRDNKKTPLIAILIAVAVIILILVLIIPKTVGKMPQDTETEAAATTESETETEAPPEPEKSEVGYAERTDRTVQLGSEIDCTHAILIDVDEGVVLAAKGGDEIIYPASMTKVMTALAAVERCEDLDDTFTMTYEIVMDAYNANATIAGFVNGEVVTVKDLLYGSILPSGADGTRGLAEYVAGSEAAFAEIMNAKCAELGLKNTHFVNSSGLHDAAHYSTCHDMAVIMEAAMENETVAGALGAAEYLTTKTTEHPEGIELHHTLLYERMDGKEEFDGKIEVIGGKTGYTGEAGNCLVTMARVAETGKTYVFVCAGGETKWKAVFDTIHVYRKYLGVEYDGEFVPKSQR